MNIRFAAQSLLVLVLACSHAPPPSFSPPTALTDAARSDAIRDVLDALDREYVFPDVAARIREAVTARRDSGHYAEFANDSVFAAALTTDLQRVSRDKHLLVFVGRAGAKRTLYFPTAADAGCSLDTGLCKDTVLAGNIGYLQVRSFAARVAKLRAPLAEAMTRLAGCDAIIVDIRRNVGGSPDVVRLLASYFFDATPVLLTSVHWRGEKRPDDYYTLPSVAGTRIGPRKPLYVLISKGTFSAAEEFAYDLQARGRAIVVGTASAGGAHPGHVKSIGAQFAVFIPYGRPINPITKTDWEGTGVRPDIASAPDSALAVALRDARRTRE